MSLRITDLGTSTQRADWISARRSRIGEAETEIATGRRINKPSDSPADSSRLMRHENRLRRVEQFGRNVQNARLWTGAADQALQSGSNNMARARTLAIQAGNDTLGPVENKALADDIRAISDGLLAIANTRVSGRAIFGGTSNVSEAYDTAGNYLGDTGVVRRSIDTNETVNVGAVGPNVFGVDNPGDPFNGTAFETLEALADAVEAGDNAGVRAGIEALDVAAARLGTAQGQIGAISQELDAAELRHGSENIITETHVSKIRDVDLAEAVIRLRSAESSYEATLAATARGLSSSLLDFLR